MESFAIMPPDCGIYFACVKKEAQNKERGNSKCKPEEKHYHISDYMFRAMKHFPSPPADTPNKVYRKLSL